MAKNNPVNFKIVTPDDFFAFLDAAMKHAAASRNIKISERRVCLAAGLSHATIWEARKNKRDLNFSTIVRCCTVLGYEMRFVQMPPPDSIAEYDEAIRERPGARKKKPPGGSNFFKRMHEQRRLLKESGATTVGFQGATTVDIQDATTVGFQGATTEQE